MADHESNRFGRGLACGHDEVTLVFAVIVINHDNHLAALDRGDGVLDGVELRVGVTHVVLFMCKLKIRA